MVLEVTHTNVVIDGEGEYVAWVYQPKAAEAPLSFTVHILND
jgi:hypothetical protein